MCTKCMRPQKLFKLIVNSFSMFEKHICIAYKSRVNANIINTPWETLSRMRYTYTYTGGGASWWKGRREMRWDEKKTNVHLLENNNEDITVCWLHHSVILSMAFFFSWRYSVVIILMKNSSKQNDKCRVTITSIPTVYAVPKKKKRIQILFGLSKTFELKIEYENMLICREFENGQWISLCERW